MGFGFMIRAITRKIIFAKKYNLNQSRVVPVRVFETVAGFTGDASNAAPRGSIGKGAGLQIHREVHR